MDRLLVGRLRTAPSQARFLFLTLILTLASSTGSAQNPTAAPAQQPIRIMPMRLGVKTADADGLTLHSRDPLGVRRFSAPGCSHTPSFQYFGGPVISNAEVVAVYWNSGVNAEAQSLLPQFYRDIMNSPYFDLLSEYSTDVAPTGGQGGTNQSVGQGGYIGAYTLSPSKCGDPTAKSCTLTDSDLQAELTAQINAGNLPQPSYDTAGNVNTVYMMYFPPNITISAFQSTSCVQFCAYHNTYDYNSQPLAYSVLMDEATGPCSSGCGNSPTPFNNVTYVSSHELAEAVTDTDVGLYTGQSIGYPVGWYDNNCGEIADICDNGSVATVTAGGNSYGVTPLWSNAAANCIVTGQHPSLKVQAAAGATPLAGSPFSFTVTATNPDGKKGTDTAYAGMVHFTSSDANAKLPGDYTFTEADQGAATFQATLAAGGQSITATDTENGAITAAGSFAVTASVQVTVRTNPAGAAFSVDGTNYTSSQSFTWAVGSIHTIATASPQTPAAGTQYVFSQWSDSGALSHTVTAAVGTTSYLATFTTSYLLTTGASPTGGGTVTPATGNYYTSGTVVNLSATANSGYQFSSWNGPVTNSGSASTTVTMTAPESVTANFTAANVMATIATSPAGLLVSVDGGVALNSPLSLQWQAGSQHTIATVSPQTTSGGTEYIFTGWSDGGAISHIVTVPSTAPTYTAAFSTNYQLTTGVSPAGGGVVTPASGGYYLAGSNVSLAAKPNAGYVFSGWSGGVANARAAKTTVAMAAPEAVTAKFLKIEPTATTLKSSANPAPVGAAVTFTATVSVTGRGTAMGTVTFKLGSTPLKTVALTAGAAKFSIADLAIGTSAITAVYSGDATAEPSTSAALKEVVEKDPSTVTVAASVNPSTFGRAITLIAKVKSGGEPTGTITFLDGATALSKVNVSQGSASFSTAELAAGTHAITAKYGGDATDAAGSSAALKLIVNKAATVLKLTSSKNPATAGQAVTLTATVTSPAGKPAGTVTFKNGTTVLGSATLIGGATKLTTAKLPKGTDTITASYAGAADYKASSASLTETVK